MQKIRIRSLTIITFSLVACLLSVRVQAQGISEKDPNSTLWMVSGNGLAQPSYLFGTYHLIKSGYLPKDGKVMKAFNNAKGVVVEVEIDSSQLGMLAAYTTMPNHSLAKLLDETEYQVVEREVKALTQQPLKMLDQLKPMSIMLFLTLTYTNEVAPELLQYQGKPLDQFFAEQGHADEKDIHSFESMMEQMDLLYNNYSLEEQADQLIQFVSDKETVIRQSRELLDLYQAERINEMEPIALKMAESYGGVESLLDKRNAKWMKTLPGLIQQKSMFVAVGALHLPGEMGLINLLRKLGYTVEPVH